MFSRAPRRNSGSFLNTALRPTERRRSPELSDFPLHLCCLLYTSQLVGGEEAMDRILRGLFNRELDPMYPYLTYQDFLNACGLTEEDLNLSLIHICHARCEVTARS